VIPIPTEAEIAQALDELDWMGVEQVMTLRRLVSETIRRASAAKEDRGVATVTPPSQVEWPRGAIVIFYVLLESSDEVLERAMRKRWDASVN
jgi:hypothetical protein